MKITYLGHAAVFVETDMKLLVDPFISGNRLCPFKPSDFNPDAILLTHGHGDHLGDAIEIAMASACPVYAVAELSRWVASRGPDVRGFNPGGLLEIGNTRVKVVEAVHSSSAPDGSYAGVACGFVFCHKGISFYHAGDTSLFAGMSLIGSLFDLDAAMLPIGGNYTMDVSDAAVAVEMLSPNIVIPMHYNTFPLIMVETDNFKDNLQSVGKDCRLLEPGESIVL